MIKCPLCHQPKIVMSGTHPSRDMIAFRCTCCGEFFIDPLAAAELNGWPQEQRFLVCASVRAASDSGRVLEIVGDDLPRLRDSAPRWTSPFEGVDRLISLMARRTTGIRGPATIDKEVDFPLLCALGPSEFDELLLLARDSGFIDPHTLTLSVDGLRRLDHLREATQETGEPPVHLGEWIKDGPPLGVGGQAVVYRVHKRGDPSAKPHVAKVLKVWDMKGKTESRQEQRGRFKREVLALEGLATTGCPNIVPVLDKQLDPPEGFQPWYVMPFYSGGPMARMDAGNVVYAEDYKGNVDRVLQIAESVATTLAWMHEREPAYKHRDVHTGNIFFEQPGGLPILGDFGLVHVRADDSIKTGGREPLGPWRWRPPEFHPGSSDKANPKSDVYLLGGVIYEALSGGLYIEETEQVGGQFAHEKNEYDLAQFTDDARIELVARLLRNMLARDPRARMSARDVAEHCRVIRQWEPGKPEPAHAPSMLLEEVAAKYRDRGEAYRATVTEQRLRERCAQVAQQIAVVEKPEPFHFYRAVQLGHDDDSPSKFIAVRYPGAVWAAVKVLVGFGPSPAVGQVSHVLLIRTEENREIVALYSDDPKWSVLAESFPDDPRHDELIHKTAVAELDRLAILAAAHLEAAQAREAAYAELRKVQIPDVSCSFHAHRLLRHLIHVSNTSAWPWVESDDALRALEIKPDELRSAVMEAEQTLGFVETQGAMGPIGFSRVRLRPEVFTQLGPKVLLDVDQHAEGMKLLTYVGKAGLDGRVSADDIERDCGIPTARTARLFESLMFWDLVQYGGSARSSESLPFAYASITARGDSVLKGHHDLPF